MNLPARPASPIESPEVPAPPASTEQDRFNALFNILRDSEEYTLNPAGTIMSSNLEAVSVSGYEEWEVIGQAFDLFYMPEDRAAGQPALDLKRAIENGRVNLAGWRIKKKGKKFWAKTRIQTLYNPQGEHTGFKMTLRDVSHNVVYSYRVKNIRSEYLNLFNNSFIGIFKFRFDDGRILILNEKAADILDCHTAQSVYFHELFKDSHQYQRLAQILQQHGKADGFEFQLRETHEPRWVSISCKHFEEGNFVEGVVLDVTQSKRQLIDLQRLNHELDQFIYHASHDLRSPLTSILGLVNLIDLEKPSREIGHYAELIRGRVLHLDTLLKDIVAVTDHNRNDVVSEVFQMESELAVILEELCPAYTHVHVFTDINEALPFFTDPGRMRTILRHLISNALKFHNPQQEKPFVAISLGLSTTHASLVIEDNGVGIPRNCQEGIFELFFKATASGGSGLGLYMVKQSVDALKGKIYLDSSEGMGSRFTVLLPNRSARA
jgi:hypothetical protein